MVSIVFEDCLSSSEADLLKGAHSREEKCQWLSSLIGPLKSGAIVK